MEHTYAVIRGKEIGDLCDTREIGKELKMGEIAVAKQNSKKHALLERDHINI